MNRILIIAEAGVNHNGSLDIAKKLVDAAGDAGADVVKFQTFKSDRIASRHAQKAQYQEKTTGATESQLEMLRRLELSEANHHELIAYCKKKSIAFLSTPFDLESIDLLASLGLETFKIPSGELNNLPYLQKIARYNKRIILSTGMADLGEVEANINVLVKAGTERNKITLLHCHSEYPTPMHVVNLSAMNTMREAFKLPVGYSDHTDGIEIPIAAAALGATVIEKHFTLDRNMEGPDHKASLEPQQLKAMVQAIRDIEAAMGNGLKVPSEIELKNRIVVRKSIHAARDLKKGTIIREEDLIMKRPGDGISPMLIHEVIGKELLADIEEDQKLSWIYLK